MNPTDQVTEILSRLQKEYPDAGPQLKFSTPFECLVAVVLSAQSTDLQVNQVTNKLFKKYNKPEHFASLSIEVLEKEIKGVGIYRNKARSIIALSQEILDKYGGIVPDNFEDLLRLPGVGRKTANVVCSVAFQKPGLGVDTHVQRVTNRMGIVQEKKPEKTEMRLKQLIPEDQWSKAHHLFLFHGRKTCRARKADCEKCPLENLCEKILDDSNPNKR
jgi:endonuclease-3